MSRVHRRPFGHDAGATGGSSGDGDELARLVRELPQGWTRAVVGGEAWGVTRTDHAGGRSLTFSAERLGGPERLSANIWITTDGPVLKPCEVPADDVVEFVRALLSAPATATPSSVETRDGSEGTEER